jgi:hypothetical protein
MVTVGPYSIVIAACALSISAVALALNLRHYQRTAALALHSNAIPVMSKVFDEFRSAEFRTHLAKVHTCGDPAIPGGYSAMAPELQESAYEVSYFFEHVGLLVAFRMIPADLIVGTMATFLLRSWNTLSPWIDSERAYRAGSGGDRADHFLPYFENLVALAMRDGAAAAVRNQMNLEAVNIRTPVS